MKLMCGKDCRRTQEVPMTLEGLKETVWDLFGEKDAHLMTSDTQTPLFTEAQYQSLLSSHKPVPPGILKISVFPASTRFPVPSPLRNSPKIDLVDLALFPQCSMCLKKMTGEEALYQFTCKHIYCPACIENQRKSLGKTACKIDGCQVNAGEQKRLKELILDLREKVEMKGFGQSENLRNEVETLYDDINAALVPCFSLIEGNCPSLLRCKYDHSPQAKAAAKGLKLVQNPLGSIDRIPPPQALPAFLPEIVPIEEEKKPIIPLKPESLPKQKSTVFDQMELAQSCIEPLSSECPRKKQDPAQYDIKACAAHIRTSIRDSFLALESSRKSQLEQFPVTCSICGKSPVLGCVFQCRFCVLFLCPKCEVGSDHPHPLFKIRNPGQIKGGNQQKSEGKIERKLGEEMEEEMMKKLSDMGFRDKAEARLALLRSNFQVDSAVEMLLFPH